MNLKDITNLGFSDEDTVDVANLWPNDNERKIKGFKLVVYEVLSGNIAAYFPEINPLVVSGK